MKTHSKNRIAAYFQNKKDIIAVYLFGSQVKEHVRKDSDIDIGIVMDGKHDAGQAEKKMQYQTELSRQLNGDVHIVVLNASGEAIVNQVFSKGECLLANDPRKLSLFKMTMIARIADFRSYQDKIQAGFVHRIMRG